MRILLLTLVAACAISTSEAQGVSQGIDLSSPRIQSGGLAIWVGNTPYRDCLLEDVSLDGRTVTFSTRSGNITVPWSQVAAQSRARVLGDYNALLAEKTQAAEALMNPKRAQVALPSPAQPAAPAQEEVPATLGVRPNAEPQKIHVMVAKVLANNSVVGERYEPKDSEGKELLSATGKMIFLSGLTEAPPTGELLEVRATRSTDLNGPGYLPAFVEAWVAARP